MGVFKLDSENYLYRTNPCGTSYDAVVGSSGTTTNPSTMPWASCKQATMWWATLVSGNKRTTTNLSTMPWASSKQFTMWWVSLIPFANRYLKGSKFYTFIINNSTFIGLGSKYLKANTTTSTEASNHLGNVLTLFTDKKIPVGTGTTVSYYKADLVSSMDYSPFGAPLKGRTFNGSGSRYGFNGQEKISEIDGNSYDYKARIYNPRLGRFLSVDPLTKNYPWYTPYQFAGNKPISFVDRDGEEEARPEEIAYGMLNPIDALDVRNNSQKAFLAAQTAALPNPQDGQQDAFRHAYWNALNARDIGASDAEGFATIHELGMTNPANDSKSPAYDPIAIQMDLFNNNIGRKIGALNPKATDEELAALVLQGLANGELIIVTNIGADNLDKKLGYSTHPTLKAGDKVAPDYEGTYEEYNGSQDTKREKKLETLPKSGTGANHTDKYKDKPVDRKTENAENKY